MVSARPVKEALALNFQLILFDNRGVGKTSKPKSSFTIKEMADDVIELINTLKLKNPAILGHSMGGAIAQSLAYHYPDKIGKMIIAQSFMKLRPVACAALLAQLHLLEDGVSRARVAEQAIPWLFAENKITNKQFTAFFIKLQETNPNPATKEGLAKQYEALFEFNSEKWVSEIKTAPLVLAGDEDLLCPLKDTKEMVSKIPNAKLHVFKNVGHVSPAECPSEFAQVVSAFLKQD
jgi:pimeloyl-ACP methyl ester carboxylesterase